MAKDSFPKDSTASATVAKLSNAYCAHAEIANPFRSPLFSNAGYFDSTSQSIFATSPFSLIPSGTAIAHELATTLPYLDIHSTEFLPTSPFRFMPLGKIHRLAGMSMEKSMVLPVITKWLGPL